MPSDIRNELVFLNIVFGNLVLFEHGTKPIFFFENLQYQYFLKLINQKPLDADELADGLRVDDVVAEEGGDDAHHAAAFLQGRAAHGAHQSQIAAAVEQRVAAAGDGAAELPRGLCDLFAVRERRPAEDGDVHWFSILSFCYSLVLVFLEKDLAR